MMHLAVTAAGAEGDADEIRLDLTQPVQCLENAVDRAAFFGREHLAGKNDAAMAEHICYLHGSPRYVSFISDRKGWII